MARNKFLLLMFFVLLLAVSLLFTSDQSNQKARVQQSEVMTNLGRMSEDTLLIIDNAVWSGDHVYIATAYAIRDEITYSSTFRCDVKCDMLMELNPMRQGRAVDWVDDKILIFGGSAGAENEYLPTNEIVSINPETKDVKVLVTKLPYLTRDVATVRAGENVYLFISTAE